MQAETQQNLQKEMQKLQQKFKSREEKTKMDHREEMGKVCESKNLLRISVKDVWNVLKLRSGLTGMCLVSEASHYLALTQFKICGSRLENPLSPFLFQFQEMLKQYEENLNNERIEKTRLSEDYESKIQMLTSVRNQVNIQPTIFHRHF